MVDIAAFARPALTLVDAVVGMEGNGPSSGDPRPLGALIAGRDVFAVDMVAAALVGLQPLAVPTNRIAAARGLLPGAAGGPGDPGRASGLVARGRFPDERRRLQARPVHASHRLGQCQREPRRPALHSPPSRPLPRAGSFAKWWSPRAPEAGARVAATAPSIAPSTPSPSPMAGRRWTIAPAFAATAATSFAPNWRWSWSAPGWAAS